MHYKLKLEIVNGVHGLSMPQSVPRVPNPPFLQFTFTLFYMKTWQCQTDTFFNNTLNLCTSCSIPNCVTCQSLTLCKVCDAANGYNSLNPTAIPANQCSLCSALYCVVCPSDTCIQCETSLNYFLVPNNTCVLCSIPNCINCSSLSTCAECDQPNLYYLNPAATNESNMCMQCAIPNCLSCLNLTYCEICNSSAHYNHNPNPTSVNDQCFLCTIPFCLQCFNPTQCMTCDVSNGYFLDPSDNQCYLCPISQCVLCQNLSSCLVCNQSSNNSVNYFLNQLDKQCYPCPIFQCVQCSNYTTCLICNQSNNYYLNASDLQCYECNISNCLQCDTLTTCLICNTSNLFFLDTSTGQCIQSFICGDNIYSFPQQCDDGNYASGDGCSSECKVETNFTCQPNPAVGTSNSVCFYIGEVTMRVVYIQKVSYANQIEILLQIQPNNQQFWDNVDFSSMVTLPNMDGFDSYQVRRNSDGTVSVLVNYNTDIQNKNITVQFQPADSGQSMFSRTPGMSRSFQVLPTDNEAAYLYTDGTYKLAQTINIMSYIIGILALILFFIGIFGAKLVAIQMMQVIQISYLSIITLPALNPCFKALSNIWFVNGLNQYTTTKRYLYDAYAPAQAKGLFFSSFFLQNYNLTLILVITPYFLSLIYFILSVSIYKDNLEKRSWFKKLINRLVFEYVFNGLMFSGYIVAVSCALQLLYGTKELSSVTSIASILMFIFMFVLMIVYSALLINKKKHFGQFTKYFEQKSPEKQESKPVQQLNNGPSRGQRINQKWYNIMIIERILVGSCLVFMLHQKLSPLLSIFIFLLMALYTVIMRPYTDFKHNVRFVCNMGICLVIQIIYLSYKLTDTHQIHQGSSIWFYVPIIVCVLLLICVVYSAVFIIRQLVDWIKSFKNIGENEKIQWEYLDKNFTLQGQSIHSPSNRSPKIAVQTQSQIRFLRQVKNQLKQEINRKYDVDKKNKIRNNTMTMDKFNRIIGEYKQI